MTALSFIIPCNSVRAPSLFQSESELSHLESENDRWHENSAAKEKLVKTLISKMFL